MKIFSTLPIDEQTTVIEQGTRWYREHRKHVDRLVHRATSTFRYPPSGSDLWRPELWTDAHWRWFFTLGRTL